MAMNRTGLVLVLALVSAVALGGSADRVVLRDGTALACQAVHLGSGCLVVVREGGLEAIPWDAVERLEFAAPTGDGGAGGPLQSGDELTWNNDLLTARRQLAELNPWKELLVNVAAAWAGFALGSYWEDHCGGPACQLGCTLGGAALVKAAWDLLSFPRRWAAAQAEVTRLVEVGRSRGYVYRACYVLYPGGWGQAWNWQ
ncbi:MAG: hypothetical protein ACP5G2_04130 [Candidatus Bipolaricaulaceae bacterium]